MYSDEESTKLSVIARRAGRYPNDMYPEEDYASTIEMPFEYITIPVPVGYVDVIERKYGKNWEKPLVCVSSHEYPYYKKQQKIAWKSLGIL